MPLFPEFGRQRQEDLRKFMASVAYQESSRIARTVTQRYPIIKPKTPPAKRPNKHLKSAKLDSPLGNKSWPTA